MTPAVKDVLDCIQITDHNKSTLIDIKVPKNNEEQLLLGMQDQQENNVDIPSRVTSYYCFFVGMSHLKMSLILHEETLMDQNIWRQKRKMELLLEKLKSARDIVLKKYNDTEEEDDFRDVFDPPQIQGEINFSFRYIIKADWIGRYNFLLLFWPVYCSIFQISTDVNGS